MFGWRTKRETNIGFHAIIRVIERQYFFYGHYCAIVWPTIKMTRKKRETLLETMRCTILVANYELDSNGKKERMVDATLGGIEITELFIRL